VSAGIDAIGNSGDKLAAVRITHKYAFKFKTTLSDQSIASVITVWAV